MDLRWRRSFYDWQKQHLERLHSLIERTTSQRDNRDGVKWRWSNSCIFPNKEIVDKFHESSVPILPKPIINSLWKIKIPPRAQLILWLGNMEKLKTGYSLFEKILIDAQQAMCPFCKLAVKTNSHILFTCQFSWCIWMKILEWWGISRVLQNRCDSFTLAWRGLMLNR